jgi:hypothetical protein
MRDKCLTIGLLILTVLLTGCATTESRTKPQARLVETRGEWNNPPGALTEIRTQEVVAELSRP